MTRDGTTFDVRIWALSTYKGKRVTTYRVRWRTAGVEHRDTFKTRALADSFRAELISAQRKGEAFHVESGLPVSMKRIAADVSFFDFACSYVDMKWPNLAGNSRKGVAETLATITPALLATDRGKPDDSAIREALLGWAFNLKRRDTAEQPPHVRSALKWLASNTRSVSALAEPEVLREVMRLISTRLDGRPSAASVVHRKRAVLSNALDFAVERKLIARNSLPELKWRQPKVARSIDKRTVPNQKQMARLLEAVREQEPSGDRLVAFFATMYYAAARPAEAVYLRESDVILPSEDAEDQWGELLLTRSAPETGARWSESGKRRDPRQLKHRGEGETRPVPCAPPLTKILRDHMRRYPPLPSGLIFYGVQGTMLSQSTYSHVWAKARRAALTPEEFASPLAKRPYDLRHAAVSTQLSAGVPATQVAEWAGHSVQVLLEIYAKCIDGQQDAALRRIEQALAE